MSFSRRNLIKGSVAVASTLSMGDVAASATEPFQSSSADYGKRLLVPAPSDIPMSQKLGSFSQVQFNQGLVDSLSTDGIGIQALLRTEDGSKRWEGQTGYGNMDTKTPFPALSPVRIGSMTKTFSAVVVLKLMTEGKIDLDASIDTYLPGVIKNRYYDGSKITVRQVMTHTSGIADFLNMNIGYDPMYNKAGWDRYNLLYRSPGQLLLQALNLPPVFAAGSDNWSYSNTNYTIVSMIIEKVTQDKRENQIKEKVIDPLNLSNTYIPARGDFNMPPNSAHGYFVGTAPDAPLVDSTQENMSWAWGLGDIISTPDDICTFWHALVANTIVTAEEWKEMTTVVDTHGSTLADGYGLGIFLRKYAPGHNIWCHTGGVESALTFGGASETDHRALFTHRNGFYIGGNAAKYKEFLVNSMTADLV